MKFQIKQKIFEKFEGLTVGVVIAKNINNSGNSEEIQNQMREQEKEIRTKYNKETLPQNPKIDAWRKAYISFGANPKESRSSVESLYSLVLRGM